MGENLSVVIPARDEERFIGSCLDSIDHSARAAGVTPEIIVVINRCTDRTEEIARARGCRIVHEDSKNLSCIRNAGVRAASGELIITVDADSRLSRNLIGAVISELRNDQTVGGGVLILPERWSLGIFITGLYLLPIALLLRISGGVFFFRKGDFLTIGGFDESRFSAEDIDFARRLRSHGQRTGRRFRNLLRAHIVTSCRKFDRFGDWYFVLHPGLFLRLLRGRSVDAANKVWYDFEHTSDK